MTAILNLVSVQQALHVTDRRLSKTGGTWHAYSNKTVVIEGTDGTCSLSYTGKAYIDGIQTDWVLAECIVQESLTEPVTRTSLVHAPPEPLWPMVHEALQRLERRWAAQPHGDRRMIEVSGCGLARRGRAWRPLFFRARLEGDGMTVDPYQPPRRAPAWNVHGRVAGSAACHLPDKKLLASLDASDGSKDDANALVAAIRRASCRDPTVGPDCLVVQILPEAAVVEGKEHSQRLITATSFRPGPDSSGGLAFSPWAIGQRDLRGPTVQKIGRGAGFSEYLRRPGGMKSHKGRSVLEEAELVVMPHRPRLPPGGAEGLKSEELR